MTALINNPMKTRKFSLDAHEIERRRLWSAVYLQSGDRPDWCEEKADVALAAFDRTFLKPSELYAE